MERVRVTPPAQSAQPTQDSRQQQARSTVSELSKKLNAPTGIELPNIAGDVGADYRQIVRIKYHSNWTPPPDLADESATAVVRVLIRRNGDVVNARITRSSSNAELDRSVERALSLRHIAPFPAGSTVAQQEFEIHFNLKARRSL
jgi:TonB family protein